MFFPRRVRDWSLEVRILGWENVEKESVSANTLCRRLRIFIRGRARPSVRRVVSPSVTHELCSLKDEDTDTKSFMESAYKMP